MVLLGHLQPVTDGRVDVDEGGFTLLELLIAVAYLALGLVAIAGMVDMAIQRVTDAKRLSVATNLATEMAERIRFNTPANSTPLSGAYPNRKYLYSGIVVCSQPTSSSCPGEAAGNTATNGTANGDYQQWSARLKATDSAGVPMLPNGVATVTSSDVPSSPLVQVLVQISIQYTTGIRTPTITLNTVVGPE